MRLVGRPPMAGLTCWFSWVLLLKSTRRTIRVRRWVWLAQASVMCANPEVSRG